MATRLGKFELPNRLIKEEETANEKYAKFIADPFESGYGHTIGNAFRRVLLSSIEGAAISSLKIDGVQHEFQSVDGIVEDLVFVLGGAIIDTAIAALADFPLELKFKVVRDLFAGVDQTAAFTLTRDHA